MTSFVAQNWSNFSEKAQWFCSKVQPVAGITITTILLSKIYSNLTQASPPIISFTLGLAATHIYRSENYKIFRIAKRVIHDTFADHSSAIRKTLSDEMGQKWLKIKNFSHEEGVVYCKKALAQGTCEGEVRTFLGCIRYDQNWMRNDNELEGAIDPATYATYQVMHHMYVDVRNHTIGQTERDLDLLVFCTKYDPFFIYRRYEVYKQLAGARALDLIFSKIVPIIQASLDDKTKVLVGRMSYQTDGGNGHSIALQCNFSHYRIRDGIFVSFESQEEFLQEMYKTSKLYLQIYETFEVTLWKIPLYS